MYSVGIGLIQGNQMFVEFDAVDGQSGLRRDKCGVLSRRNRTRYKGWSAELCLHMSGTKVNTKIDGNQAQYYSMYLPFRPVTLLEELFA